MSIYTGQGMSSVGLEMAQVKALTQIVDYLPAEIDRQAMAWDPVDEELAAHLQIPHRRTIVEKPPRGSYYPGTRMGVLSMPWDFFPSISVMSDSASLSPESFSHDQASRVYTPALYIEGVIRSDAFERGETAAHVAERIFQEGLVDRRTKRTIEALVQCIDLDPSLGGTVVGAGVQPSLIGQTDAFMLDGAEPGDQSKARVFSMLRIQYNLDTYAARRDTSYPAPSALPAGFGA